MSILNPTPGELLDRLSILELKIDAFYKQKLPIDMFEAEKASIEERLREWEQGLIEDMVWETTMPIINESKNALAAVNALLWKAEDDVRSKKGCFCHYIADMNDARSEHKRKLDTLYGLKKPSEKIYATKTFVSDIDLGM